MADRKLIVQIIGDSRSVERAFKRANKSGSTFDKTMRGLAYGGTAAFGAAMLGVGYALKRGFGEVMDGQKVMAQTNAVLKSTGGVANVTAKHVDKMASSLSTLTGVDDEVIGAGENMLLTFTNVRNGIGKGNQIFDKATKAVLDLSVATGKDMTTSAIMVGKALNDVEVNSRGTITGWSALRRVGVKISADMMKQGAAFIKAGRPMKAQQLLLRELNTEFGGSAKAFGTTLPGSFAKLHNALDELTGAFATGLAPVVQKVATMLSTKMADPKFVARVRELGRIVGVTLLHAFKSISDWTSAHWPEIVGGFRTFTTVLRNAVKVGGQLKSVLLTITTPLRVQFKILLAIWNKVLGAIAIGASILSHLPTVSIFGHKVGGDNFAAIRDAAVAAQGALKNPLGNKKKKKPFSFGSDFFDGGPRAHGGPVAAGKSYLVGERGPEMFVPGASGTIIPNGGGSGDVVINLDGREIARVSLNHITRLGKRGAGQSRGRLGGQNLALG